MKALVLAAGRGTRIRSVAEDLPKPLLSVGGCPILEHTLRWLAGDGVSEVWINLHYQGQRIRERIGTGERFGLRVRYSEEEPILGTAGAVARLREEWDRTFLVVYGDNLIRFSLSGLLMRHRDAGALVTLALFDPGRTPHTGIAGGRVDLGEGGIVRSFVEDSTERDATAGLINAGVYAMESEAVKWIPEGEFSDFGKDVFPRMLAAGTTLHGHLIDGYCLGIDTPDRLARAMELIERGEVRLP